MISCTKVPAQDKVAEVREIDQTFPARMTKSFVSHQKGKDSNVCFIVLILKSIQLPGDFVGYVHHLLLCWVQTKSLHGFVQVLLNIMRMR